MQSHNAMHAEEDTDNQPEPSLWCKQLRGIVAAFLDAKNVPQELRREIDFDHFAAQSPVEAFCAVYHDVMLPVRIGDHRELKRLLRQPPTAPCLQLISETAAALRAPFVGDAHHRFFDYVRACWATYCAHCYRSYQFPIVAMVQSAGFGKTRLLRELALQQQQRTAQATHDGGSRMRVLYVNVRDRNTNSYESTYRLPPTAMLRRHFFPDLRHVHETPQSAVAKLATKLIATFDRVMVCSGDDDGDDDESESKLMDLFDGRDGPMYQWLCQEPQPQPQAQATSRRAVVVQQQLVLAIDDARTLLHSTTDDSVCSICWLEILRHALVLANHEIRTTYTQASGIFVIAADSDPAVSVAIHARPPSPLLPDCDPSRRRVQVGTALFFPPFVVTDTLDVYHHKCYKASVAKALQRESSDRASWRQLRDLGRPLWSRLDRYVQESKQDVIAFAARKLLNGVSLDKVTTTTTTTSSYNDTTLYGVASMLCRLGLTPHATSPMAARLVADFMAVLVHVGYEHDQWFTSYASDPILTLGATRVWYGSSDSIRRHGDSHDVLADHILPQLHKLLHQELLTETGGDSNNKDDIVARVVLLLAMDACGVLDTGTQRSRWENAGEFCSVWTFLCALHGNMVETTAATLMQIQRQWCDWRVSFTHFVSFATVPTSTECLWAMLGRRAAGVVVYDSPARVELVIPICTMATRTDATMEPDGDVRVSMIVVRVGDVRGHHQHDGDDWFSNWVDHPILRIEMNLRATPTTLRRVYREDENENAGRFKYVLGMEGLAAWDSRRHGDDQRVEIVTKAVANELSKLLAMSPRRKTMVDMVAYDLQERDEKQHRRFGEQASTVKRLAMAMTGDVLLCNKDHPPADQRSSKRSRPDNDQHT